LWSLVVFVFLACSPQERQPPLASSQSVEWWDRQIKEAKQYVDDPVFRRAALVGSLANPKNSYSKMRLENYNETKWGALPAWNPRVRKVVPSDIGQKVPKPDNTWTALEIPGGWSKEALLQLGEKVFHQYPAQLELSMLTAIANDASVERYGLWRLDDWVGGLIWVDLPGGVFPALTCATCHGSVRKNKTLVPGRPNHRFSLGAALDDHFQVRSWNSDWGGGRIDISRDEINNPVVIADLRPVRYQSYLQRAATIKNSILALAIRLETNTVVITGRAARAPRKAMVALAFYIWQLADSLPLVPEKHPGRKVFEKACASCHKGPGLSGPPAPIEVVRTDPNVANSPQRFTGTYQTPSLRGLSDRQRLTASGSFTSIAQLLDPARTTGGHPYGQDLNAQERISLIDFLNKL
jgi:hypothetical protein